jgi:hypothetical protein
MASVDLVAVVGAACFGVGIVFGAILVMAAGIRAEGQLAWPRGTATLRDDPASRMAQGIRRINGVGLRTDGALVTGGALAARAREAREAREAVGATGPLGAGDAEGRPTGAGRATPAEAIPAETLLGR